MNKLKLYLIVILYSYNYVDAQEQGEFQILKNVVKNYSKAANTQMDVTIDFESTNQEKSTYNGVILYKENCYRSSFNSQEVIVNKQHWIIVNKATETIMLGDSREKHVIANRMDYTNFIDSTLINISTLKLISTTDKGFHYRLQLNEGVNYMNLEYLDYYISNDMLISKVCYHYKVKDGISESMIVSFNNVKFNEDLNSDVFSIEEYVDLNSNKKELVSEYKNYRFINAIAQANQ